MVLWTVSVEVFSVAVIDGNCSSMARNRGDNLLVKRHSGKKRKYCFKTSEMSYGLKSSNWWNSRFDSIRSCRRLIRWETPLETRKDLSSSDLCERYPIRMSTSELSVSLGHSPCKWHPTSRWLDEEGSVIWWISMVTDTWFRTSTNQLIYLEQSVYWDPPLWKASLSCFVQEISRSTHYFF